MLSLTFLVKCHLPLQVDPNPAVHLKSVYLQYLYLLIPENKEDVFRTVSVRRHRCRQVDHLNRLTTGLLHDRLSRFKMIVVSMTVRGDILVE